MKTLSDAWKWYQATKRNLRRMQRLGSKHWMDPSLENSSIWQDDAFRNLEESEILAETSESLAPIDDLAVIVLFSVFESHVRDHLIERMKPEADLLTDPILKSAASSAQQGVEQGSFFLQVLEPLKSQVATDLVTQVNQVRDYRNWVAHGKRNVPKNLVTPSEAFNRLNRFLAELGIAVNEERRHQIKTKN
jgi:hypothetical protein